MVISESKKDKYCTEISNGDKTILSDVTEEKGGRGEHFRPHDLLCAGLASCLNITTRMILERKGIEYEKVVVKVDIDKSDEKKTKFLYNVDIIGDISDEIKQSILEMLKKSPVKKTLSKEIEFEVYNKDSREV